MSETQTQIANYLRGLNREPTGPNISEVLRGLQINPGMLDTPNSSLRAMMPVSSYGDPGVAGPPPAPPRARPLTAVSRPQMDSGSVGALNDVALPPKTPATPLSSALDKAMQPATGRATSYDTSSGAPQAPLNSKSNATTAPTATAPAPNVAKPTGQTPQPSVASPGPQDDGFGAALTRAISGLSTLALGNPAQSATPSAPTPQTTGNPSLPPAPPKPERVPDDAMWANRMAHVNVGPQALNRPEPPWKNSVNLAIPGAANLLDLIQGQHERLVSSGLAPQTPEQVQDARALGNRVALGATSGGIRTMPPITMPQVIQAVRSFLGGGKAPPLPATSSVPQAGSTAPGSPWRTPVEPPAPTPKGVSPMPPTGAPGIKPWGAAPSRTQNNPFTGKPMGAATSSVPEVAPKPPPAPEPQPSPTQAPASAPPPPIEYTPAPTTTMPPPRVGPNDIQPTAEIPQPTPPFQSGGTSGQGRMTLGGTESGLEGRLVGGKFTTQGVPQTNIFEQPPVASVNIPPMESRLPPGAVTEPTPLQQPPFQSGSVGTQITQQGGIPTLNVTPQPSGGLPTGQGLPSPNLAVAPRPPVSLDELIDLVAPTRNLVPPNEVAPNTARTRSRPAPTESNRGARSAPKQNTSEQAAFNALLKQMQRSDARRATERTTK